MSGGAPIGWIPSLLCLLSHTETGEVSLRKTRRIGENGESMHKRLVKKEFRLRAGLALAITSILLFGASPALGWLRRHKADAEDAAPKGPVASMPPAFVIPVDQLGFFNPGQFYLGQRESLVSLGFLDENRILFTFRAPGLIHRANPANDNERQIRAEVLTVPQGTIETEALWTLHDRERYLWMLHNGRFLLRDADTVKEGDARLDLKPLLQFPGPVLSLDMDPTQQFLVTNSEEPEDTRPQEGGGPGPATAAADVTTDRQNRNGPEQRDIVLRILSRASGKVMLVSRIRAEAHLPIGSEGYLETLRGTGKDWTLSLDYFTGGSKILGKLESSCQPPAQFVSSSEVLVNACAMGNGRRLVAYSTQGQKLWEAQSPATQIWPILIVAPDHSLVARETLTLDHSIEDFGHPLSTEDIKGQWVEVFDAIEGKSLLKAPASPVLDGGGNVAFSPSGKRVAILNAGAIQVYELPGARPVQPPTATAHP